MKYKILISVIIVLSGWSCITEKETTVLHLGHSLPRSHPVHQGILVFQQALETKSSGALTVKIFPDSQLGSEREVLELLQIGSVAATKVSAATLSNFVPEYHLLGVPYLFRDKQHLFDVLEGQIGKSILEKGSKFWLRGLCYYDAGSRSFYTSEKPIRTPDDLKGLKIRVMNNQMAVNMVNAMGASATPLAYSELYTALQQGVVDGAENNPPSFVASNHYEISKFYTIDQHSFVPDILLISTKFWDKLSEDEKLWVQEAAEESARAQRVYWDQAVEESMKIATEAGVEIIIPDKSLFAEKTAAVMKEFVQNYPEMEALLEQIKTNE